jgi:hypothetical protein
MDFAPVLCLFNFPFPCPSLSMQAAPPEDFQTQSTSKMWALRQLLCYCAANQEKLLVVAERYGCECCVGCRVIDSQLDTPLVMDTAPAQSLLLLPTSCTPAAVACAAAWICSRRL